MAEVIQLDPGIVGDAYRFEPDDILEKAKGRGLSVVAVIGRLEDGSMWVSASAGRGETMILMELAKHDLIFGED